MMMMKANTASLIHYSVAIAFIFLTHYSAIGIQNKPKSTHDESSSSASSNSTTTTSNTTRNIIIIKNHNEIHPQRTKLSPIRVYDVYTSEMRNNTSDDKKATFGNLTAINKINHRFTPSNSQKSLRSSMTLTPVGKPNITKITAIAAAPVKLTDLGTRGEEVLTASSSGGDNDVKDKGGGGANTDDEEQKSLSEQVSDGKYALIQNEIFTSPPRRPGVLSYDVNPEVPKDNVNNLGGLDPDDIWLAENHLLVLAGNSLGANQHKWRPIDDYIAPKRPVQLPPNPRVPPPFPVQLTEDGPAQYIGNSLPPANPFSFFNPVLSMQYPTFGGNKTSTTIYNQPNNNSPPSLYNKTPYGGGYGGNNNINPKPPSFFNHPANLPPPLSPAQQPKPPPGAEFIPTYLGINNNQSDALDEDDPSLYYPPPYDFYYPQQNNSRVPAGPLVPGIVLPPPPNFFTQLGGGGGGAASSAPEHPKTSSFKEKPPPSSKHVQKTYKSGKKLQPPVIVAQNHPEITPLFPVGKPVPAQFNTQDKPSYRQQYSNTLGNEIPSNNPPIDDDDSFVRGVHLNTIPQNATGDNEWIPIPAPQPYYITGPRKPNTNKLLVMMESPPLNYHYKQAAPGASSQSLSATKKRPKQPSLKFLQYVDDVQQNYPSTTPLVSQIVSTPEPPTTTAPSTTPIPSRHQPTIKATYYFYEEPNYIDVDHSTRRPPQRLTTEVPPPPTVTSTYPPNYPTSTISSRRRKPVATPPMLPMYYLAGLDNSLDYQNPTTLATPAVMPLIQTTIRPSYKPAIGASYDVEESPPIRNYNGEPTSKPLSPLSQFLDDNYENESPSSSPPPPPSINHYNNKPTPKPISEFSYIASNYEDPVRVVQVQSTAKPPSNDLPPSHYHIRYNTFYRSAAPQSAAAAAISYPMLDAIELINKQAPPNAAQTTPSPPPAYLFLNHFNHQQQSFVPQRPRLRPQYQIQLPIQQSQVPPQYQLSAAQSPQPWLAIANPYNGGAYQPSSYTTENPYYAFFTKEDEDLIDENTKKYFSLFGQKLNHPTDDEAAATGSAGGNGAILEATSPLPPAVSTHGSRWKPLVPYYPSQSVTSTTPSAGAAVALIQSTTTPSTLHLLGQQPSSESSSQYPPPSNFIRRPLPPRDSPVNYVTITSPSSTPPLDTSLSSSANEDSDFVPSKHIRPIIVSDLPRDLHERLRNIQQLDSAVAASHRVRPRPSYTKDTSLRQSQSQPEHYSSAQSSRKPVSLHSDTRVNYIRGGRGGSSSSRNLHTNPDAEYITPQGGGGAATSDENQSSEERHHGVETRGGEHQKGAPISLHDDILVNYKWGPHLTALNPDAEFIQPRGREALNGGTGGRGSGSSTSQNVIPYNEYRQSPSLDRGHFYFLSPSLSSTANRSRQRSTARSKQPPAYENTRQVEEDEDDDAHDEERRDVVDRYHHDDDKGAPRRGPGIGWYQKRHGSPAATTDEQRQGRRGKETVVSSTESRDS